MVSWQVAKCERSFQRTCLDIRVCAHVDMCVCVGKCRLVRVCVYPRTRSSS